MYRYISLFLAILLLLPPVSKVLYVVDYTLNKEYIISVYCINRDKPQLGCEGKCHLNKLLAKSGASEKTHILKEKTEIIYFISSTFCLLFAGFHAPIKVHAFYNAMYAYTLALPIFHPPQRMQ